MTQILIISTAFSGIKFYSCFCFCIRILHVFNYKFTKKNLPVCAFLHLIHRTSRNTVMKERKRSELKISFFFTVKLIIMQRRRLKYTMKFHCWWCLVLNTKRGSYFQMKGKTHINFKKIIFCPNFVNLEFFCSFSVRKIPKNTFEWLS